MRRHEAERLRRAKAPMPRATVLMPMCLFAAAASAAPPHHPAAHRPLVAQSEPAHAIPPTGVLNTEDLIAIAKKADSDRGSADQFTDSPTNVYAGRTFHAAGIEAASTYDISRQALEVLSLDARTYIIAHGKSSSSEAMGQNAFGAKAKITSINTRLINIKGQVAAYKFRPASTSFIALELNIPADPSSAKELSQHLTWVVDGTLVRSPIPSGGRADVVQRTSGGSTATLAMPFEVNSDDTNINAHIEKVSLVDSATGKILAEGGPIG